MPQFHLHIRHRGYLVEDLEGAEFDDLDQALEEARASLRELVAAGIRSPGASLPIAIEINDEHDRPAARITVDAVIPKIGSR